MQKLMHRLAGGRLLPTIAALALAVGGLFAFRVHWRSLVNQPSHLGPTNSTPPRLVGPSSPILSSGDGDRAAALVTGPILREQ